MIRQTKNMPIVVSALRSAIKRIEEQEDLSPNDPVLRRIKSAILRTIAERDIESREDAAA